MFYAQGLVHRQEYAADARAVQLIDAAGLDGRTCVAALLAELDAEMRLFGHPPVRRRLAKIRRASRVL